VVVRNGFAQRGRGAKGKKYVETCDFESGSGGGESGGFFGRLWLHITVSRVSFGETCARLQGNADADFVAMWCTVLRRSSIRDFQSFGLTIFKNKTAWTWTWHSATKVSFHCLLRNRSRLAIFAPARSTEKVVCMCRKIAYG